jgi:hypothetical protein
VIATIVIGTMGCSSSGCDQPIIRAPRVVVDSSSSPPMLAPSEITTSRTALTGSTIDRIATMKNTSTSASSTPSISGRPSKRACVASNRIADSPPTSYWISASDARRSPPRRSRTKASVLASAGPSAVATLTR